jgi:hypothetical protein
VRFVVLGTPAIGAKHFFPSSAPALKAGAVDLVIQRAEESEMAFFGRREFADYFAVRKAHFLLVLLDRAKIRRQRLGAIQSLTPVGAAASGAEKGLDRTRSLNEMSSTWI